MYPHLKDLCELQTYNLGDNHVFWIYISHILGALVKGMSKGSIMESVM